MSGRSHHHRRGKGKKKPETARSTVAHPRETKGPAGTRANVEGKGGVEDGDRGTRGDREVERAEQMQVQGT